MPAENNIASKYVILLDEKNKSSVRKAEKQLNIKLTSSVELSSKVRAQDVLNTGDGLFLKNLGVAIIDNYELDKLKHLSKKSHSPIVYWEKERVFKSQTELGIIDDIYSDIAQLTKKVKQLEDLILKNADEKPISASLTWGLSAIDLNLSKFSGKGIDICILDSGFYRDHPDFKGRNITGKSFVYDEPWDIDVYGHGTHVVGTAAGNISHIDNVRYGIAYEANIVIAKVLDDSGNGTTSGIIDALDNCIEKNYKLASMSLGSSVKIGEEPSPIFEHVGNRALENNCLIVAAAGNDSKRPKVPKPVNSPANAESIMAVSALTKSLKVANFSNAGINAGSGGRADISAPGVSIFSSFSLNNTKNKLYRTMNGTSMATPHVAGIAALYWEAFPNASAKEIWLMLEKHSKKLSKQLLRDVGQGLVQAL